MMFDLKKPCVDCPFRRSNAANYGSPVRRLREIIAGPAFECHHTTGIAGEKKSPQQCAGLIAMLETESFHNKITRVAMILIQYDPRLIDNTDTFKTIDQCIAAHNPRKDSK